jgi:hypothetical protein
MIAKVLIPAFFIATIGALEAAPSGAIFTTDAAGTIVNANVQYNSKCEVYLDGGPGPNAPSHAAGLPAGDYYFQVTDPNGQTLLSTDPVSNRRFTVSSAGVISAYTGTGGPAHPTGVDRDHPELGAITISLANASCPVDFIDSPNNGGVYKVWATRVSDFSGDPTKVDNACSNGCFHGFLPSKSKTDDFKARPTLTTFCVTLVKQWVDGGTISAGVNFPLQLTDPLGVTNTYFTDGTTGQARVCDLSPGTYTAFENTSAEYNLIGLVVNGVHLSSDNSPYGFSWRSGRPEPVIVFQNQPVLTPQ